MRIEHVSRSTAERRHYCSESLSFAGIERRSSRDNRTLPSDDDIDESEMTLADGYWAAFFSPTMNKTPGPH